MQHRLVRGRGRLFQGGHWRRCRGGVVLRGDLEEGVPQRAGDGSDLDFVVACSRDALIMVEGGAAQVSEEVTTDARFFAHQAVQPVLDLIEKLRAAVGRPKRVFTPPAKDEVLFKKVASRQNRSMPRSSSRSIRSPSNPREASQAAPIAPHTSKRPRVERLWSQRLAAARHLSAPTDAKPT